MTEKKISFGFSSKSLKKLAIIPQPIVQKKTVQLIDCLESNSIKIKDAVEIVDEPLVIPLQSDTRNLIERVEEAKKLRERSEKTSQLHKPIIKKEEEDTRPDSELTLDELAERQLIQDAKRNAENGAIKAAVKVEVVPAVNSDSLLLEGSKEPTLDDYDDVPIGDFGLAMLRGMGWKEGTGIGRQNKNAVVPVPELRPKGMGLGAYKMITDENGTTRPPVDKNGKELQLVKGAHARIIAGKEKGFYCKVESLDDETGRVVARLTLKNATISMNESMLMLVTTEEYNNSSRVINISKYEEYKDKEKKGAVVNVEEPSNSGIKPNKRSRTPDRNRRKKSHSRSPQQTRRKQSRSISPGPDKNYDSKTSRKSQSPITEHRKKHDSCRKDSKKSHRSRDRSFTPERKKTSRRSRSRSNSYDATQDNKSKSKKESKRRSRSRSYEQVSKGSRKTKESCTISEKAKKDKKKKKSRRRHRSTSSSSSSSSVYHKRSVKSKH